MNARFLAHWLTTAAALGVTAWLLPGVEVTSLAALAVAALVLGLVNAFGRPALLLLTLPFTVLSLGLFYFVVNGLAFGLAAAIVPGFGVTSFFSAILGAFMVGLVSWFIGIFAPPRRGDSRETMVGGGRRTGDRRWRR